MIWLSSDLRFKWFWLSTDLRFHWCGCQLIWDSTDLGVNRFEIQMSWLSIDLRFKWFGCQMVWGSSDPVANWCVIQMILSHEAFLRDFLQKDLWSSKTKLLCETSEAFLRDFLQKWNVEAQKRKFSARLPSKLNLWSSKTKLFCETSSKIKTLKLKNEAFLRDFLQKWHVNQTLGLRIPIRFNDF